MNTRLKKLLVESLLKNEVTKEALRKKWRTIGYMELGERHSFRVTWNESSSAFCYQPWQIDISWSRCGRWISCSTRYGGRPCHQEPDPLSRSERWAGNNSCTSSTWLSPAGCPKRSESITGRSFLQRAMLTPGTCRSIQLSLIESGNQIRKIDTGIPIDNFGTRYSSLACLKSYLINELKIDKSFVEDITKEGQSRVIASTIIKMNKTLGFSGWQREGKQGNSLKYSETLGVI